MAADLTDAEKTALDLQMGLVAMDSRAVTKSPTKLVLGAPVTVSAARATLSTRPAPLTKLMLAAAAVAAAQDQPADQEQQPEDEVA